MGRRVAGDENPSLAVTAIGLAVMRGPSVDAYRLPRSELGWHPREAGHHVGLNNAPIIGGQRRLDAWREPEATGVRRAFVDRDQDRNDPPRSRVSEQILVRAEPGASRLLVVELVLEGAHLVAHRVPGERLEGTVDQRTNPVMARAHVLRPADHRAVLGLLGVVAPDVAVRRPRLHLTDPA